MDITKGESDTYGYFGYNIGKNPYTLYYSSVGGTAQAGVDFQLANGSLYIPPHTENLDSPRFQIFNEDIYEGDEIFDSYVDADCYEIDETCAHGLLAKKGPTIRHSESLKSPRANTTSEKQR